MSYDNWINGGDGKCTLCETREAHTTGIDAEVVNCKFKLVSEETSYLYIAVIGDKRVWIPVVYCPWCGRKL